MNKSIVVIVIAILLVGLSGVAAFVYVNQTNLTYQREQQSKKDAEAKEQNDKEADIAAQNASYYLSCTIAASKTKTDALKANSEYETKDSNGETIYHGNATIFNQIDQSYQKENDRCSQMYK